MAIGECRDSRRAVKDIPHRPPVCQVPTPVIWSSADNRTRYLIDPATEQPHKDACKPTAEPAGLPMAALPSSVVPGPAPDRYKRPPLSERQASLRFADAQVPRLDSVAPGPVSGRWAPLNASDRTDHRKSCSGHPRRIKSVMEPNGIEELDKPTAPSAWVLPHDRRLIHGRFYGKPQQRISKAGKQFVTANVCVPMADGESVFANLITFRQPVGDALLALDDG